MITSIAKPGSEATHVRIARLLRFALTAIVVAALCYASYNVGRLWHNWRHSSHSPAVPESPDFAALLGPTSLAGQWTFANLDWSLRSEVVSRADVASKFDSAASLNIGSAVNQLPDLNQELIDLARKLRVEPAVRGENQIYSYDRPNLKGQLVVHNVAGRAKAISLIAAFPKDSNQWQVFEFAPRSAAAVHGDDASHLLPLPPSARRTGGRFSDDGQLLLELVTLESNHEALLSLWEQNGWTVHPAQFAGPDDFCYLCARGTDVIYAWSANPRDSLRNLMLVRTPARSDVQSQASAN